MEIDNIEVEEEYRNKGIARILLEKVKEIAKSFAIELLLNDLEVDKNYVYTIGDGYSDIEMIRNFNGYCMKESVDELKEIAEKEFESVSELVSEVMGNLNE